MRQLKQRSLRLLCMRVTVLFIPIIMFTACTSAPDVPDGAQPSVQPTSSVAESQTRVAPEAKTRPLRTQPRQGEVVFYQLHPNWSKVDRYCGAFDRSYVVRHVSVPEGARDVLGRAIRALFQRYWNVSAVRAVSVEQAAAHIDLSSTEGIGFAGTSCGGVGFMGSLLRTVFQFDSVDSVRVTLQGSCQRFGEFMQAGRCQTFTRGDI